MPKQDVNVKSYVRRGKLVRNYKRKQDRKNNTLLNTVKIIGGALGVSAITYLVLRKRYVNNLNAVANNLKANPDIGEKLADNVKDITFTIGGFGSGKAKGDESPLKQAEAIMTAIRKDMNSKVRKNHKFVALDHNFTFTPPKNQILYFPTAFKKISSPLFSGRNDESVKLAEQIYSWYMKNPTKKINIIGYSAGSNMARDIQFMLDKKGVKLKLTTIASSDFKIHPTKKALNIMGDNDWFAPLKSKNAVVINNINTHMLNAYLQEGKGTNKLVTLPIIKYLYD